MDTSRWQLVETQHAGDKPSSRGGAAEADPRLPLYLQARDALARQIAEGHWKAGEAIPPEEALAARYGVAMGTMRKAIEGLVAEGRLERRQGRGTFVRRGDFNNALARFFRMTDDQGRPIRPEGRVLACEAAPADMEAAGRLGLGDGAPTIRLTRLRLIDGAPILAEDIRLPAGPFAPLLALAPAEFGDLLYPLYERLCGRVVASARETIRFGALDARVAARLGAKPGDPAVIIDRVAYGFDAAPLEFRRSYGPPDKFSYSVDIR